MIRIINSKFTNNGTGIRGEGKINLEVIDSVFSENNKDIDLFIDEASNVTIDSIESLNCRTDSITVKAYTSIISEAKKVLISQKDELSHNQLQQIETMIDELNNVKDKPDKIKKILINIYDVAKGVSTGLLVAHLKNQFNWQ